MKNVKVILIGVALCATVFANARIDALGGDATFWPGDRANAEFFPGALNDANWVEFGGVEGDPTASINWGDDTKWGFNFDSAGNDDWINMSWAKNGMGLSVGFTSESAAHNAYDAVVVNTSTPTGTDYGFGAIADGCTNGGTSEEGDWTDCTNVMPGSAGTDNSGFDLAWGKSMSFGDLGVGYTSYTGVNGNATTDLSVNWRGDMSAWVFDTAKAAFSMTDNGAGTTGMNLDFDLFTHVTPADGVDVLFGLGFGYGSTATDQVGTANNLTWDAGQAFEAATCTTGSDGAGGAWDGSEANCSVGYDAGQAFEDTSCTDGTTGGAVGACDNESLDYAGATDGNSMFLPSAILAVEAQMTDWATVRAFVKQDHQLSCDDNGADCGVGNTTMAGFGVGFGWQAASGSSINLDMEVSNQLFVDPITTMSGWDSSDLANGAVTLSYTF